MKKWLLFFTCFSFNPAFSQEKVFEYDLSQDREIQVINATIHTGTPAPYSHALVITKTSFRHLYISPTGQKREVLVRPADDPGTDSLFEDEKADKHLISLYRNSDYLLHDATPTRIIDVLYRRSSMKFFFVATDPRTGLLTITDTVKIKFVAEFVGCFQTGKAIHLVHYVPNRNEFIISSKEGDKKIRSETIKLNFPGVDKQPLIGRFKEGEYNKKNRLVPTLNFWLPVHQLDYNSLAFATDDKLIMLLNDYDDNTWYVTLELDSNSFTIKKFQSPLPPGEKLKKYITSWITDSTMIRGYANADSLNLFFYRLDNSQAIGAVTITRDNFENYYASPIVKSGDFWSKSNVEKSGFPEFLKKCRNNKLLITGYQEKNKLFLTLATRYSLGPTASLLGNVVSLGMMEFREVKLPSILSFDISLDLERMKFGVGETKSLVWDKMLMFLWGKRAYLGAASIGIKNDHYYISYYNMDIKKIFVHRFYKLL